VDEARPGDEVELDLSGGVLRNLTLDRTYGFAKPPSFLLDFVRHGGLIPYLGKRLGENTL
jgi:3-isopropylmalate/(R)-2-methylmalate dehydratase small subunit